MKIIRSAKIVVLDADGKALLLHRSGTHPDQPHRADLPGGTIEANETIEAGAVRELKEEAGLEVEVDSLKLLYALTHDRLPGVSMNCLLYGVRIDQSSPEISLSWEHESFQWVELEDLVGVEKPYQVGIDYAAKNDLWPSV